MKKLFTTLTIIFHLVAQAQDKPNILWLVTEDMSPYLSCYGNTMIKTPNLDKLASEGIRYTQAHSNSVYCSPSRSTLVAGKYAISLGTDIHREKRPVNDSFYFPIYLRQAGYYCTNNSKQDYNNIKTPETVWNESSNKANYFNRTDKSKPFFAVYNQAITHMTRVVTPLSERDKKRTVALEDVIVPRYIPDLPEVRNDISWNMDAVILMDKWIGQKIEELKEKGEYDNTIIFFYSDHGGTVPRGKAYAYQTGTLVPLIIYFPPKWRHLAGMPLPNVSNRFVSFVDFAPTVLSLAGVTIPSFIVGKPFLTDAGNKKENIKDHLLTFRANQGPTYAPARSVYYGDYHLIWNFQSAYPNGTRQNYQWQMPAQQAWDVANKEGKLTKEIYKRFWEPLPAFELYNIRKDSVEIVNLANDPAYIRELNRLKALLLNELHKQKDVGLLPPQYRRVLQKQGDLFSLAKSKVINTDKIIEAASLASQRDKANFNKLITYLHNNDPAIQYWGASGLCVLTKVMAVTSLAKSIRALLTDEKIIKETKCLLAEAIVYTPDSKDGLNYLLEEAKRNYAPAFASLQNVGSLAKPIAKHLQILLEDKNVNQKFFILSILINCDVLPYSSLYVQGEKVAD